MASRTKMRGVNEEARVMAPWLDATAAAPAKDGRPEAARRWPFVHKEEGRTPGEGAWCIRNGVGHVCDHSWEMLQD